MCGRNEDRDQLLTDSICRGHPQIKVQSVASPAGATATASIVNQPFNGHLNGRPSDPFDQEECYARCTVAANRAQSLTVIISQLDMAGMMGMMQVLAARARPIHQVYHGATTWTLPSLNGMTHQEQSDAEVASWDISRVSSWSEQTLPPLALAYKHRIVEAGETKSELKRLRLILVEAAELPGARSFVPSLKRIVKANYDQRHRVTLPPQHTDELLLWAYALDGKQHAMFWLSPENQETAPFSPILRHWQSATPVSTRILKGMHFFDAWRIAPTMRLNPLEYDDLDSFEGEPPPREKWELRAQADARTDAQLVREQTLQARAQNKTSAQMAAEIAQVHKLATLLAERVDFLADLACSRHGYMDHVRARTSAKADKKGLKRRAGDDPPDAPLVTPSVPAPSGVRALPMEVGNAGRGATSASSSTARASMDVDSATAKGPSTTDGAMTIPRELANDILAAIPHLPNEWPLAKIDLILQNTDKYYMSWRRFLFVHELLRTFNEKAAVNVLRTNAASLVEHLVEFLSEWIVTFLEPAREVTKVRDPELLFLHEKDYWFRAIWQDIHLAASLDRVKSRDRPPVGLVRCICKDARSRGEEGTGSWTPVKLSVSNVHIFVPIWMIPDPVRHVRLLASRDIQPKTKGWIEYKEGWFEIRQSEATAESTLCGMQIHYGDQRIDPFPTEEWKLIERFAQEGLLKQEVWSSRLQWLGVKAKIEIPLSGTGWVGGWGPRYLVLKRERGSSQGCRGRTKSGVS